MYLVWNVTGHVTIKVTKTAGSNAVLSGLFFDPATPPATATPLVPNTTTQGSWKTVFGSDGQYLAQDTSGGNPSLPSYATVTMRGQGNYTWAANTSALPALEKSTGTATDRLAATWYASQSFEIDVRLTDGNAPDRVVRARLARGPGAGRVQVIDTASGTVLDTRSISNFKNGVYLVWNVSGNVTIKVTRTAGSNAVISGLFFDPVTPPAIASYLATDTTTQGNWKIAYGALMGTMWPRIRVEGTHVFPPTPR